MQNPIQETGREKDWQETAQKNN